MDAILYYLVFTEDTNGTIIYINKSTMNELNNREQEQYAEPTTKKSSKQIVKRTLVVIGLALAVYVVYSVIYLFISIVIFSRFIWFRKMRHLLFNHQLRLKIGRNLAEAKHGNV